MSINALFTKYTIPCEANGGSVPKQIKELKDLGCIAFSQDNNPKTFLHRLFSVAHRIHSWIFRRKNVDRTYCHGMVIIGNGKKEGQPNNLLLAHSVFSGVQTSERNYLNPSDKDVTGLVIYVPKDEKLRQLLIDHARQTAYTPQKFLEKNECAKEKVPFSISDMLLSIFHNRKNKRVTVKAQKQLAYLVADLLKGNQLMDEKGNLRSFFCTAYAVSILQGSLLINAMSEKDKADLKVLDRDQVARNILSRIKKPVQDDSVSKEYFSNKICRMNSRFLMSGYAGKTLDKFSSLEDDRKQSKQS